MKLTYCRYENNVIKILRAAKSLITPKTNTSIPLLSDILNYFFTLVDQQAPIYNPDNKHTINEKDTVRNSFYLHPITCEELKVEGLFNSGAVGSDGLYRIIITDNFDLISNQVLFIFNLSFAQGIFPKLLKTAIVTPIYKSGSRNDPSNYRPISLLTIFSKLLEKLFYNRLLSFINS